MYSRKSVDAGMKLAEVQLGFEPVCHSVAAADEAVAHFDLKRQRYFDKNGFLPESKSGPKLLFDEEEERWIENERRLCTVDYQYFATRYGRILSGQEMIHYVPNKGQLIANDIRGDLEDSGWAIIMLFLKGRQVGITTDSQIVVAHRTFFYPNVVAITGSSDKERSAEMIEKYYSIYELTPYWLRPERTVNRTGTRVVYGNMNSRLIIQHGAQKFDIGRGNTPTCFHLCLSPHTLIRVEDGRLVPVSEVRTGEIVINMHGEIVKVKRKLQSPRQNEMTSEIRVWGTPTVLSSTRDHPILTERGWIEAKDVVADEDWISYPLRPISATLSHRVVERYIPFSKPGSHTLAPREIPASFEFGRLCGFYLAEGSIKKSACGTFTETTFSIHSDEEERTLEWIDAVFPSRTPRIANRRKNSKSCVLPMAGRGSAEFFEREFGQKDSKRVPDWCWNCGREFAEGLIYGYLAGDGHYAVRDNCIYATSIRPAILFGLRELMASLGYGWSGIAWRKEGFYYNRNCRDAWIWTISGVTARAYREKRGFTVHPCDERRTDIVQHWKYGKDGHLLLQVRENGSGLSENFYDLEVDCPSHSFLTACGVVHNSELASYLNAADLIDAGLMPAIHESPNILGIGESTGEGPFGWLYDTWDLCKKNYWKRNGRARWCPVFLPWFVREDYYPTPTWLKRSPVPVDWIPMGVTLKHAERARKYVLANEHMRKHYPENWRMPRAQMWYWEATREGYRAKKKLAKFMHEYAADDLESFMASGESVFDVDTIAGYNHDCQEPLGVFGFRAAENIIPARLQAEERDRDTSRRIIEVGPYAMVPLRWEGYQSSSVDGKALIFEWPEEGRIYGVGVDTGDGVGMDNTVAEGIRKGDLERPDGQVFEYASNYINALDLVPIVHCLALLYQGRTARQPKIAIETGLNGEVTQLDLRKLGWSNFHDWVRYDRRKLDRTASRIGFVTNRWSRPMLIDLLVKALRDGEIDVKSPEFVREMQSLHRDEGVQALRAETGQKDDRFMALGIIYLSLHILEVTGKTPSIGYLRQKRAETGPLLYREPNWGAIDEPRLALAASGQVSNRLAEYFGGAHPGASDWGLEAEL